MPLKIDDTLFSELLMAAEESPRQRSHYNLHKALDEPVQRFLIGLKKGTYVRPHHHPQNEKWELMLVLRGAVAVVLFNESGNIIQRLVAGQGECVAGVEIEPNSWHTVFPCTDDAVVLEVKQGPYLPSAEHDFAPWAPAEGAANAQHFLDWLYDAEIGDRYHA